MSTGCKLTIDVDQKRSKQKGEKKGRTIICVTYTESRGPAGAHKGETKRRNKEGRRGSTPPPVERTYILRPPCRRRSQQWVSISHGPWWERRSIPGWPIRCFPRVPRDSSYSPRSRFLPSSSQTRRQRDPGGSSPVLVTVSITLLHGTRLSVLFPFLFSEAARVFLNSDRDEQSSLFDFEDVTHLRNDFEG